MKGLKLLKVKTHHTSFMSWGGEGVYSSMDRSLFTSFTFPNINKALALMKLNTIFKRLPRLKSP